MIFHKDPSHPGARMLRVPSARVNCIMIIRKAPGHPVAGTLRVPPAPWLFRKSAC
jgi:hypothetical protein